MPVGAAPVEDTANGTHAFNVGLRQQGFLVLDGAMATELEHHGANLDDPLWSAHCLLESPELIYRVHTDYLTAGADIIASSTYQASHAGFAARGLSPAAASRAMALGIELAIRARDDFWAVVENRRGRLKPMVAASMGPFGACLHDGSEYHGRYAASQDEVRQFHRQRLAVLARCGADLLAFETIPSLSEADGLLAVLSEFPDQSGWISFSCRDDVRVSHGETFRACAERVAAHHQVLAVGINCTAPRYVDLLLQSVAGLRAQWVVYPNSGETWAAGENTWHGQGGEVLQTRQWFRAGASIIGGCCRTRPADIARIRATLQQERTAQC